MYGHHGLWAQNYGGLLKSMKIYFFIYYLGNFMKNMELYQKLWI